jgi:uncharacterized membrane protein YoaK (UPF0700 family)
MTGAGHAAPSLGQQAAASLRHPLTVTLLVLTFSTGTVDAVSYLNLGHVFTANMTGNIVLLGFGIAGAGGLPVLAPVISTAAFAVGSGFGGVLARRVAHRHAVHVGYALGLEASALGVATIVALVTHPHSGRLSGYAIIICLALGMGIRNATVRHIAVPDLTTTVLTMTLTGLAADSKLAGGSGNGSARRFAAISAMLAGAVCGALMLRTGLVLPLAFTTALALVTCLSYMKLHR